MAYATLDSVKRWLLLTSTSEDAELTEILNIVHSELTNILSFYITPPSSDDILADIEAMWAAGIYRTRREPSTKEHIYVEVAKKRLQDYINYKLKRDVRKA